MKTDGTLLNEDSAMKKAAHKAKKLRGFYSHLRTYLVINSLFLIANLLLSPGDWWVLYPAIGWGFCLAIHAIDLFLIKDGFNDEWEEKKTRELLNKYTGRGYENY